MTTLGLIGFPVNHSKSPEYFLNKLKELGKNEHSYKAFELEDIKDFHVLLEENPHLTVEEWVRIMKDHKLDAGHEFAILIKYST